jgi:NADPH:quinone reductase-like Zn-dependent oxidoreductase
VKAIVIHKYGGPEELKFEDYADPVSGPGEVSVRITATSINPFDLMRRSGAAKDFAPINFPGIVGVDLSGVVVKAGPGVRGFSAGDHVFEMADETYAELCVAKAFSLTKIPAGFDVVDAAPAAGHNNGKPIDLGGHWNKG